MTKVALMVIVGCSMVAGWLGREFVISDDVAAKITKTTATMSSERQQNAHSNLGPAASIKSKLQKVPMLHHQHGSVEAFVSQIPANERGAFLEALANQAGPDGLNTVSVDTTQQLVELWAREDFTSAYAWANGLALPRCRTYFLSMLVDKLAKFDADKAFALYLQLADEDPQFRSSAITTIYQQKAKTSAEAWLSVIAQYEASNATLAGSSNYEFAPDFDYPKLLEGLLKLQNQYSGHLKLTPMNAYASWAKQDTEGAYAWWREHGNVGLEGLPSIMAPMADEHGHTTTADWVAEKFQEPNAPREQIIRSLTNSYPRRFEYLGEIADAMPTVQAADSFLNDALAYSHFLEEAPDLVDNMMTRISTADGRLKAIEAMSENGQFRNLGEVSDERLQKWGINRLHFQKANHYRFVKP